MGRPSVRGDCILTMDQVRLILALHDADLSVQSAAHALGISDGTARGRAASIQLHTGVDVLTLYGLRRLYDPARALADRGAAHGQTD